MKRTLIASLSLLVACGLGACSGGADDRSVGAPVGEAQLVITNQTPTLIEGTFVDGTVALRFQSVELAPRKANVTVRTGEAEIAFNLDFALGEGEFDAKSGQLDEGQVSAMPRLMTALSDALPSEDTVATDALGRTLNFLSEVPPSTQLPTFKFVAENRIASLSCGCRWQDAFGYFNWMGQGESCGTSAAPHCPGRCGKGCGPDRLVLLRWGTGAYTADCARHDYGVGSLAAAADDYAFANPNCVIGI